MAAYIPRVAVVILNWNGRSLLEKFLPSVCGSSYPKVDIILADNASTDDSVAFVQQKYPHIRVIANAVNLGFAGGYNAVLEQVEADYYILLNSDVEVTPDWINPMVALLEQHPDIAAAQPKIRDYTQPARFEHAGASGGYIDAFGYPFCRGRILEYTEVDDGQYDDVSDIFWASGAALFIRATAWKSAGGFDADFFAHMEEIDLCWRLKRMGHRIIVCPASVVYHVGAGTLQRSNPRKTYLNFRNNLLMLQKNLNLRSLWGVLFIRLWLDLAALLRFLAQGKVQDAWAVSRAHQYFFRHIFTTARKRKAYPGKGNTQGWYRGSILVDHYLRKVLTFDKLKKYLFLN